MREIRFRAWDTEENKMIYMQDYKPQSFFEDLFARENGKKNLFPRYTMQFTGLHDKNGKEIYEGDIANVTYAIPNKYPAHHYLYEQGMMDYTERAVLKWDNFQARYYFELENSLFEDDWKNLEVEVIGNLYEHPELLSQSK